MAGQDVRIAVLVDRQGIEVVGKVVLLGAHHQVHAAAGRHRAANPHLAAGDQVHRRLRAGEVRHRRAGAGVKGRTRGNRRIRLHVQHATGLDVDVRASRAGDDLGLRLQGHVAFGDDPHVAASQHAVDPQRAVGLYSDVLAVGREQAGGRDVDIIPDLQRQTFDRKLAGHHLAGFQQHRAVVAGVSGGQFQPQRGIGVILAGQVATGGRAQVPIQAVLRGAVLHAHGLAGLQRDGLCGFSVGAGHVIGRDLPPLPGVGVLVGDAQVPCSGRAQVFVQLVADPADVADAGPGQGLLLLQGQILEQLRRHDRQHAADLADLVGRAAGQQRHVDPRHVQEFVGHGAADAGGRSVRIQEAHQARRQGVAAAVFGEAGVGHLVLQRHIRLGVDRGRNVYRFVHRVADRAGNGLQHHAARRGDDRSRGVGPGGGPEQQQVARRLVQRDAVLGPRGHTARPQQIAVDVGGDRASSGIQFNAVALDDRSRARDPVRSDHHDVAARGLDVLHGQAAGEVVEREDDDRHVAASGDRNGALVAFDQDVDSAVRRDRGRIPVDCFAFGHADIATHVQYDLAHGRRVAGRRRAAVGNLDVAGQRQVAARLDEHAGRLLTL